MKNILIVFLCFALLFVCFTPSFFESESLFDVLDGHRQVFMNGAVISSCNSGDFLLGLDCLYIIDTDIYDGETLNPSDLKEISLNTSYNRSVFDFLYQLDSYGSSYGFQPYYGDLKIDVWYSFSDPLSQGEKNTASLNHLHDGDLWYDLGSERCYIFTGRSWQFFDYEAYESILTNPTFYSFDFDTIFKKGYECTFGTFEVLVSIFKGPDAFFTEFDEWRSVLFGDVTIVSFLDSIFEKIPVVRDIKHVIEKLILPFEDIINDIYDFVRDKVIKEK